MDENQIQSLAPNVGSLVEIRRGSAWHEGVITQTPTAKQENLYTVKYTSSNTKDSLVVLKETVSASMIRPRSPCKRSSLTNYEVFQEVETFYEDGWWSGVVLKKNFQNDESCYSVYVFDLGEEILFKAINLRKKMDWVKGSWIAAEEAANKEDIIHLMFGEGKQVEVSSNTQNYGVSWHAATVLKIIGKSYFLVEYATSKRNKDASSLQKVVGVNHIRPCPPVSESTSFKVKDKVEVFHEGGWILGVIAVRLAPNRYIVKISKGKKEEAKVFKGTSLRPYHVWSDDHCDQISQDMDLQDIGSVSLDSRGKKNALIINNENHGQSSQSTKKIKVDTTPEKFCLQDVCHYPSTIPSFYSEYDCNISTELPLNDIVTQSSVDSIEDNQNYLIKHVDKVCERVNIFEKDKSEGCEKPLGNSGSNVQSEKIDSPFSTKKKDEVIKLVESIYEVLHIFPQEPHFRPLLKYEKAVREGLAYGSMIGFANLVNAVKGYTIDVSEDEVKEKLRALAYFEEHGFSIQPVQTYLNNLIMLRKHLDGLECKSRSTMAELEEVEHKKERENSLLSEIEKNILILNDQKTCVISEMKKLDCEVVNLESVARTVEADVADAKKRFNDILAAPW